MSHRLLHSLGGAVLASLALAVPAHAATVFVRIEGANGTLLPRTQVTTSPDPVPGGDHCAGDTVAGAIDVATHGNWDQLSFTQTILGETHKFDNSDYWAEWLDYKFGGGICSDVIHDGDDVLMLVDYSPPPTYAPTVFPLRIVDVPATVQQGAAVTVTVVKYTTDGTPGTGTATPEAGVTVAGGGDSATTDGAGHATLTMSAAGDFALRATKAGDAPSASEPITVLAPGTVAPPKPQPVVAAFPYAHIAGIADGQRFAAGHGPRTLSGKVDASGLTAVKLRLTRRFDHRCYVYSNHAARFDRVRCGANRPSFFSIGTNATWSYLLPAKLGPGRYVLDVTAVDASGRRDALARGRNRVVFTVAG
jgi:hypothetical protein